MTKPRYPTTPMCDGALLEAFEPTTRDTDVFCATAAKCGQTWLLTLLHHLRTRGTQPDLGGNGLGAVTPWLELPFDMGTRQPYDRAARLAWLDALDDPRIFKMHVLWEEIPRPKGSRSKVVTITRDPRELPWSMYSHLKGMQPRPDRPEVGPFEAYFERWMEFGYFFKFCRSFWPHHDDPDLLWLRYEDLKADLRGQTHRILDFLGWELTDDEVHRVLPLVDLEHMQRTERDVLFGGRTDRFMREGARFVREGRVGANRQRLSAEQEQRILTRVADELDPACARFVLTLGPRP